MSKHICYILLFLTFAPGLLSQNTGEGKEDTIKIGNHKFFLRQIDEMGDTGFDTNIELYSDGKKLLTHTLFYKSVDCNSISIELGAYNIKGNTITFYSYWALKGDAPVSPFGVRKQVYKVDRNGNITLSESEIYLEAMRAGWGQEEYVGIDFIYKEPVDRDEEELLKLYKETVEKEYNAKFVSDQKSKNKLFKEVRQFMKEKIDNETSGWEDQEESVFGYKK